MAFKIADSAAKFKKSEGEQFTEAFGTLSSWITQLKKDVQSSRQELIKERLGWNRKNLQIHTSQLQILAMSRKDPYSADQNGIKNMLSFRIESALCKLSGSDPASGDRENVNSQEEVSSSIIFGNNNGGKCVIRLISLPYIEKIPPYTSWIFLDRNQRMAEDQSVVGRRRIYYDQYGSEALICSDSEEEVVEPEEEKQEFSEGEDQILRKVLQEHGLQQEVLNILSQFIEADSSGIKARYETLMEQYQEKHVKKNEVLGEMAPERNTFFNKSLSAALDSFDNLFCRRCLIFDCRLHGCSQGLIIPSEKLSFSGELEERGTPCSNQCYLGRDDVQDSSAERSGTSAPCASDVISAGNDGMSLVSNFEDSNSDGDGIGMAISDGSCMGANGPMSVSSRTADISKVVAAKIKALDADKPILAESFSENIRKRKMLKHGKIPPGNYNSSAEEFLDSDSKKQKKIGSSDPEAPNEQQIWMRTQDASAESTKNHPKKYDYVDSVAASDLKSENLPENESAKTDVLESPLEKQHSISCKGQVELAQRHLGWNLIEKELYLKGIEIFGKNSCLIARNLLPGLKTCIEVSNYMCGDGAAMHHRSSVLLNSSSEDNGKADPDYTEQEMPTRTRFWRRRGRARKLKYTWKSAGHPSIRKRMADGKQQCKQYTPCGCQPTCGKQCPCLHNGTCCEKYCGCSKSCKNRFRGCHCAKSQCRSRQCPCFAAGRECDPDVCRNCWVSCGDGTSDKPPARGDDYQCGNMKLLLKQQQRILLGKSNVAGWGAFIKNPVNKNEYLGEYTGELISHREADKRGKIYDRANSSFLFDLNDQFVLDAYRKGDKLKFANHSSNPNCYAKVMMVAGDHRVGIFAKEHIDASEELFYDYRYEPDRAPIWARKPEGSSSKRDDSYVSHGRAQKKA